MPSWRCSSDWLRMEILRKTWLTPLRSRACSTAAATAASCTVPKDPAIWEISRMPLVPGGGDSASTSTSSPRRSRSTTRGSRSSAIPRTLVCSLVRSPVTLRPNQTSRKTDTITASSPMPPARMALVYSQLLADPLIADSCVPIPASAVSMAPRTVPESASHVVAFTGSGPLPASAVI